MSDSRGTRESAFAIDTASSIGYLIRIASRRILAQLQLRLEPYGVTLGQYFVLRELWQREGLTQRELSERIDVQEPGTVAAIDAMEKRDLVVRVRSTNDRRKINVYLTARGRGLRDDLLDHARVVIDDATDDFSDGERAVLRDLLQRITHRLAPQSPEEPA